MQSKSGLLSSVSDQDRRISRGRSAGFNESAVLCTSHYGVWNRLFKSFRDLLGVRWLKSRQLRYRIAESLNSD
jgi:hypothetical protein